MGFVHETKHSNQSTAEKAVREVKFTSLQGMTQLYFINVLVECYFVCTRLYFCFGSWV